MKHLKKLASVLLALVMALALMAPAFASGTTPKSTIQADTSTGHTYAAYQIFTATVNTDKSFVANSFEWGTGVDAATVLAELQKINFGEDMTNPFVGVTDNSANNIANILWENFKKPGSTMGTAANNALLGKAIYDAVEPSINASTIPQINVNDTNGAEYGYCLLKETVAGDSTSAYHLAAVNSEVTEISTKKGDTTGDKQVVDPKKNIWSDGGVYQIDDEIPFRLVINLPESLTTEYNNQTKPYNLVLHDFMHDGLDSTSVKSLTVKIYKKGVDISAVPGADIQPAPEVTLTEGNGVGGVTYRKNDTPTCSQEGTNDAACSFEIAIDNLQMNPRAEEFAGGKLVVEYTAKLKEGTDLKFGPSGNLNELITTVNGEVKGTISQVKVYDLELDVNKVSGDGKTPLTGAEFTLYGPFADDFDLGEIVDNKYENLDLDGLPSGVKTMPLTPSTETDGEWVAGSQFKLTDLAPGKYVLRETELPQTDDDGHSPYNQIDDIAITITADISPTDKAPTPGDLSLTVTGSADFNGDSGNVTGTIMNATGIQLPETGGIGTTIFYIVGGVLVVGAVVLLITKRRAGADEE